MNIEKFNFNIPYYILDEITEYIEFNSKGKLKVSNIDNIKSFLNLAVINGRISKKQAQEIEKEIFKEC